mmetsp:Transcript_67491/g.141056  ORF Transcript_67491/g.141056 Transcript_67491/m.141056 type:complete len:320 (+) Transcript_67491:89-1048(+)
MESTTLLPYAHPADLIRSHQKDEQHRGELRRQVCEIVEEAVGHRSFASWQAATAVASDILYGWLTVSQRTLGEEYTELLPVTGNNLGAPRRFSRFGAVVLSAATLSILQGLSAVFAGGMGPRRGGSSWRILLRTWLPRLVESVGPLLRLHLAIFYLFGAFRRLSDRAFSLRFLSLAERPYRGPGYQPLGVLLILQLLAQAFSSWSQSRAAARGSSEVAKAQAEEAVSAMFVERPDGKNGSAGKALRPLPSGPTSGSLPMCNICFCPTECTTCPPCGHLFCWECIASWCAIKASCPLCRAASLPQQLLPLCHYEVPPSGS